MKKRNVLIFGFLQLLVCMPMTLLSSEEQYAANKHRASRNAATRKMNDFVAARCKEGLEGRHLKEFVIESEGAHRAIRQYTSDRKKLFDCKVKSIENDSELTEEEKAKKKKKQLRDRLKEKIEEQKIKRKRREPDEN